MKKTVSIMLVLVILFSLCVPVSATQGTDDVAITYRQIKVIVNGVEITPCDGNGNPTEPFIMNSTGTTYLPVRAVANALGLSAAWDSASNTISLTSGEEPNYGAGIPAATSETKTERITYRDISIYVDGAQVTTPAEPFIMNSNSTTYLPLRAVAGALGLTVGWDSTTSTVTLNSETKTQSSFSIHFIDVGQADAALIECDGHYMLIDGGNKADSDVIYSVLKKANVSKLDIVVGTHAHEDHIGGIPGAFSYTTSDLTLCPVISYDSDAFNDFATYAGKYGGGITVPGVGDTYELGSSDITILGVNGGGDTNDTSIILKIEYGETSFLFTGDAEREAEQAVLNSGADISATLLKVGHHGADTSTTYPFLMGVMPRYAVISVGDDNNYGHPADDTLSRLRDADVAVYRTDLQGDIYVISDGKTLSITTDRISSDDEAVTPGEDEEPTEPPPDTIPDTETTVYITPTGKRYHMSASCAGKNAIAIALADADAVGYTPCGKCAD